MKNTTMVDVPKYVQIWYVKGAQYQRGNSIVLVFAGQIRIGFNQSFSSSDSMRSLEKYIDPQRMPLPIWDPQHILRHMKTPSS